MTTIDLRTPLEKVRAERCEKICSAYVELSSQQPDTKPYRIMRALADKYGMTAMGVREILTRNGLFAPKHKINRNDNSH